MADDSLQTGTDVIATDHVSTLNGAAIIPAASTPKVQRTKVTFGDDGSSRDVSASFPLPVVASTGAAFVGYTGTPEDVASKQGRFRWSGGKATTSAVSPNASATLTNPAGSGVDLILMRYQVEVDASADVVVLYDAVSTGTLQTNTNPNWRTTVANPGEVRVGSGVLTGGTVQSFIRRPGVQSPVAVGPFSWRMIPGSSLSVRFLGPGATNNVWFVLGWYVVAEGADLV